MPYFINKFSDTISNEVRSTISMRYKAITRSININFWNSISDSNHSLYVGSYGRGTAIKTSDIDILVELPLSEYSRFDSYSGNGQSRLLQAVKEAIQTTYTRTDIKADGQIIKVLFSDNMKLEILPAFKDRYGKFLYADSNLGGKWKSTNPKAEQDSLKEKNISSNGLLFDTCKHLRYIRDNLYSSYYLSGIVIDSFVYNAIGNWSWPLHPTLINCGFGEYEKYLQDYFDQISFNGLFPFEISAPGSYDSVPIERSLICLKKVINHLGK